jgi:hypothetical protein
MRSFKGNTLSWELTDGVVELVLHRQPNNEIGSLALSSRAQRGICFSSAFSSFLCMEQLCYCLRYE